MSALLAHAKAARHLAQGYMRAAQFGAEANRSIMLSHASAHIAAAETMEAEVIAEAEALNAPCSLRHDIAKGSKCPGCGKMR